MALALGAVKNESYAKRFFFWKRDRKRLKGAVAFGFCRCLIVSAFGQWCSVQTHAVVLKSKLRNAWDVILQDEGTV